MKKTRERQFVLMFVGMSVCDGPISTDWTSHWRCLCDSNPTVQSSNSIDFHFDNRDSVWEAKLASWFSLRKGGREIWVFHKIVIAFLNSCSASMSVCHAKEIPNGRRLSIVADDRRIIWFRDWYGVIEIVLSVWIPFFKMTFTSLLLMIENFNLFCIRCVVFSNCTPGEMHFGSGYGGTHSLTHYRSEHMILEMYSKTELLYFTQALLETHNLNHFILAVDYPSLCWRAVPDPISCASVHPNAVWLNLPINVLAIEMSLIFFIFSLLKSMW